MAQTPAGKVFISYSHDDKSYLDRLQKHLKPHVRSGALPVWVDTQIKAGDEWKKEIEAALDAAQIAILLVSVSFLASDFVAEEELPKLLKAAEERGVEIVPVILTPCSFKRSSLYKYQAINDPSRPLSLLPDGEHDVIWNRLVERVLDALEKQQKPPAPPAQQATLADPLASPESEQAQDDPASEPAFAEPTPAFGRFAKVRCPYCFQSFYLGDCAIVSSINRNPDGSYKLLKLAPPGFWQQRRVPPRVTSLTETNFAAEFARRVCPSCKHLLPSNIELADNYIIALVGFQASGKTSFIATCIHELVSGTLAPALPILVRVENSEVYTKYLKEYYEPVYEKIIPPLTQPGQDYDPLIYVLKRKGRQMSI